MPNAEIIASRAGILRRLAAIFYDGLVLVAVLLAASAVLLLLNGGKPLPADNPWGHAWFLFVTFGFFAWFWTHGGQTLGMRAWKIQLVSAAGGPLSWGHALLRFMTALPAWLLFLIGIVMMGMPGGPTLPAPLDLLTRLPGDVVTLAGALWILWDNSRFTWRDRFCQSYVINKVAPVPPKSGA